MSASDVLTEPSALHLTIDGHCSNFRMGGRFGPRLFTGKTEHNRDYVVATVGALEQLGYRETDLHLLAARLAGTHEAAAMPLS